MITKKTRKNILVAASVAGLVALSGMALPTVAHAADVHCSGINACKGVGECGGKGNSCAGKNACKGMGWVKTSAENCEKLGGKAV